MEELKSKLFSKLGILNCVQILQRWPLKSLVKPFKLEVFEIYDRGDDALIVLEIENEKF